jgi:FkbM family methyltransferase
MITQRDGWWMPTTDRVGFKYISAQASDINTIVNFCQERRVCIQAGGNIGIWPAKLSEVFEQVITAEPDEANFNALTKNTEGITNITKYNSAFGKSFGSGSIKVNQAGNMGALSVRSGDNFHIIPIDSLNLTNCDLIQLDVEGYELFALAGAINTINKYKPTICIELNGLSQNYGHTDEDVVKFLTDIGYIKMCNIHRDVVFDHHTKVFGTQKRKKESLPEALL